jgi:hypothetical protein
MEATNKQPGDVKQLVQVLEAGERYYEDSRKRIVVYWDGGAQRYRLAYQDSYPSYDKKCIEVVTIPW